MTEHFDPLRLTDGNHFAHFRLPVTPDLSTPFDFLYGGSGIAASIEAAERVTERPLMWITTQFLTNTAPGTVVDLDVATPVAGRATSQVQVNASVDGELMLSSLCAHTSRPEGKRAAFFTMPSVPPPKDCGPLAEPFDAVPNRPRSFFDSLDRRVAAGKFAFGEDQRPQPVPLAVWSRVRGQSLRTAASLAFIGDIVPLGICIALGQPLGGTSIDNTLRIVQTDFETEWALLEIIPESFQHSIGHGSVRMWSETGELLAVAQQTCIIRTSHHSAIPAGTSAGADSA